jgi:DNA-binding CsgD family transcriptional regulator
MSDTEQLSVLIGDIYDAALDRSLWVDVLRKAAQFVGGQGAGLLVRDAASKSAEALYTFGVTPHYLQLYLDQYAKIDPTAAPMFFSEVGQVATTKDLVPYDEFLQTRFYREWAQPQGWVDSAQSLLEKSVTGFAQVSFLRNEVIGLVDDATRRCMRLIVPHMRRAVLVGNMIDLKTTEAATFADAADGMSAGMFFVDASGRIVHANASGYAMLAQCSLVRAVGGKVVPNDAGAERALCEVYAMAERGDEAVGVKGIAVPLTAPDGERHLVHVLPLTSGARRRAGAAFAAVAAVFVRKAAVDIPSPLETVGKIYKLTPTELRVLFAIVQIGGVPEVAEMLGIAVSTAKTHLRRLFAKTGTNRQVDLVKLVAGYASPLVG